MSTLSVDPSTLPLCDIVMEGGITSGVIYPKAVVKLSEQFRIKNIGGTSAGAIAAAATAAAELGRLRDPQGNPGYKRLAGLAEELAEKGFSSPNSTRLMDLFQPQKNTRPLFMMLISALNQKSKKRIALRLVSGAVRGFHWKIIGPAIIMATITALTALILIDAPSNFLNWLIAGLFFGLVVTVVGLVAGAIAIIAAIYCTLKGPLVDNGFGICKGYHNGADKLAVNSIKEPLTLWLSRMLNQSAGFEADGPPLTFGALWSGTDDNKSKPPPWLKEIDETKWHYIDLQMMTTNVTHGRPYRFPFKDDDQLLYFKASEMREWFPSNVVDHMIQNAGDFSKVQNAGKSMSLPEGFYMLPESMNLPVVFATRLSLSFPFLLSAVPLYATDFESSDLQLERCWFSDGGISSNFPIHLFDAPLPLWPTFGIKLERENTRHRPINDNLNMIPPNFNAKNRFFFPTANKIGRGDSWAYFDEGNDGFNKLSGFINGLLSASLNWRDNMLTRTPGIRDRVVRVYLKDTEGGLNLNMNTELVRGLSMIGEQAAIMLAKRFSPGADDLMNFDNHRWVRLRTLAALIEQDFKSIHPSLLNTPQGIKTWEELIKNATNLKSADQYPINSEQELKLLALLKALDALSVSEGKEPTMLGISTPKRMPTIRIVPNM